MILKRLLSVMMLMAFLLVSGSRLAAEFCPHKKQTTPAGEGFELTAMLPAHSPAADDGQKFQKTVSEVCFFQSGSGLSVSLWSAPVISEFFPAVKPQHLRLLEACISINAP